MGKCSLNHTWLDSKKRIDGQALMVCVNCHATVLVPVDALKKELTSKPESR